MWHPRRTLCAAGCAGLLGVLVTASASANDSSASLDADGLHFTYNPNIEIDSEALWLSLDWVGVGYRFHNTSEHDISTLVAFPLPIMYIGEDGNYILPDNRDPINFIDFQVTADGKRVEPQVEVRATRFGIDVSEILKKHGIPLTMLGANDDASAALYDKLNDLPDDAKQELERYGVIDWTTSSGAGDKPLATTHWQTSIAFYWFQTFPAQGTIEVRHRYHPVPRHFFFSEEDLDSAEMQKTYCFDRAFADAARAMLKRAEKGHEEDYSPILKGKELRYVLTTAENWLGPIKKFSLRVEKPSADALVSLCAEGIKRTSPTSFELTAEDYSPSEDLNVLFLEPMEGN
ncbi:DUF4424 family protein [Methyloceanibacter sp.]|uniref:DUF4424 family protein n=1 Tax=Methyloceanibacter sp. TaxID=1965321 RepID=UPI002D5148CB|nr:DUF4424 family protein [Methyloceanibacter sp.]HZP08272.1 DUF4424 family protein [Methyloceanibacter sp.]